MSFIFIPWNRFIAITDRQVGQAYLRRIGAAAERIFRAGVASTKSGRVYRLSGGRQHRASAPGEYPAAASGAHLSTISHKVTANEVTVGSGMFYAQFLRNGTSKMAARRMSQHALEEAVRGDSIGVGRFARFRHV